MYNYFSSQCLNLGAFCCLFCCMRGLTVWDRGVDGVQHVLEQPDGVPAESVVCVQRRHVLGMHDDVPQHDAVCAADAECVPGADGAVHVHGQRVC